MSLKYGGLESQSLVSGDSSLPKLQVAAFSLCSLCACGDRESVLMSIFMKH